jgi:hypothetical protein
MSAETPPIPPSEPNPEGAAANASEITEAANTPEVAPTSETISAEPALAPEQEAAAIEAVRERLAANATPEATSPTGSAGNHEAAPGAESTNNHESENHGEGGHGGHHGKGKLWKDMNPSEQKVAAAKWSFGSAAVVGAAGFSLLKLPFIMLDILGWNFIKELWAERNNILKDIPFVGGLAGGGGGGGKKAAPKKAAPSGGGGGDHH